MIVIGADTHKRTHILVAVDAGTGEVSGGRQIAVCVVPSLGLEQVARRGKCVTQLQAPSEPAAVLREHLCWLG